MGKGRRKRVKPNNKELLKSIATDELLDKAQEEINTFQYDSAQKFLQEALKRDNDDLRALELSASLCIELENYDSAKHCLGRAITLAPEWGFSKYLSLAQLLDGRDSLQCYQKGIELIKGSLEELSKNKKSSKLYTEGDSDGVSAINDNKENELEGPSLHASTSLPRKLSNAFCAVAELYMSDLCDEEEAETESLNNINQAIKADSNNPEAFQYMANYLLIKEQVEEARSNIKKSVSLWLPKYLEVERGEASAGSFDPVLVCPLTESARFLTARILIEVQEHDLAADVLEGLLGENDEIVYTWYLLGWNNYLRGESHRAESKQQFLRAMEINPSFPSNDQTVIDHIKELLAEMSEVQIPSAEETDQNLEEHIENLDLEAENKMECS